MARIGYLARRTYQRLGMARTMRWLVEHTPAAVSAWGDNSTDFRIMIRGQAGSDGTIKGTMERPDMPGVTLPIRLILKEQLP